MGTKANPGAYDCAKAMREWAQARNPSTSGPPTA